ncbi:hypothetical protein BRARA_I03413 [Brassica rapa]|uniref:Uncharacterized protein n=1 Tax=Brassica campestris TaxID=3711 RepID=A0A397XZF4_BRACM|nr:hypothetical protein BRARA_I03413 [Brassica rapa]
MLSITFHVLDATSQTSTLEVVDSRSKKSLLFRRCYFVIAILLVSSCSALLIPDIVLSYLSFRSKRQLNFLLNLRIFWHQASIDICLSHENYM